MSVLTAMCTAAPPRKPLFVNYDSDNFFQNHVIPGENAGAFIDKYVDDSFEGTGVTVLLINTNDGKTTYQGRAWESYWEG
jgi:hypothetical protein